MSKLPVLISIPHGGIKKPIELEDRLCITDIDLFEDIDPYVVDIYKIDGKATKVIFTDIARTFVDLNRAHYDLPPQNPDGVVKSVTCYKKPIYLEGKQPDERLTKRLLDLYYHPYHKKLQRSLSQLDLQLGLDCHSMAEIAPEIAPDGANKKRPTFCLSNQHEKTSSKQMIEKLGNCLLKSFDLKQDEIKYNEPFLGGYITRAYGNNPIPWIQIEMNRKMYLSKQWFDKDSLTIDKSRLIELNKMFEEALKKFFS